MTLVRGLSRTLFALVVIALICLGIIAGAPIAARQLTLHYLANAGVDAHIGNVDVNLFTGAIAYDDIEGHSRRGDGFAIGHLGASLDYAPLLSRQISLSQLILADARIDVRRTASDALRVGGIQILPSGGGSTNWGLALRQLSVGALRVHYSEPGDADSPAVDREFVFNNSGARDLVTWEKDNNVPVDADVTLGDGRLRVRGRVIPFGDTLAAHIELSTENLALDQLAPIVRHAGVKVLSGRLDSRQQIDIEYTRGQGVSLAIDGKLGWQDAQAALADGPAFAGDHLQWQGRLTMHLPGHTPAPQTDAVDTRMARGLRLVDPPGERSKPAADRRKHAGTHAERETTSLQLRLSDGTTLAAANANEPRTSSPRSRANRETIDIEGQIQVDGLKAEQADGFKITQKHGDWRGVLQVRRTDAETRINADSSLSVAALDADLADNSGLDTERLDWHGKTMLTLGAHDSALAVDGHLNAGELRLALADSAELNSKQIEWQGRTTLTKGDHLGHEAKGRLQADTLHLALANSSLTMDASALSFDGGTRLAPGGELTSHGTLHIDSLDISQPDVANLHHDSTDWRGKTSLTLDAATTRLASDGKLDARGMRLAVAGRGALDSARIRWQGQARLAVGEQLQHRADGRLQASRVRFSLTDPALNLAASALSFDGRYRLTPGAAGKADSLTSDGTLQAEDLAVRQPSGLDFHQDTSQWQGDTRLRLGAADTRLTTDGDWTASGTRLALPDSLRFASQQLQWRGNTVLSLSGSPRQRASGRLDARDARLDLANAPLAFDAADISFDGHFQRQPARPGGPARLGVTSDADAQHLHVIDTAIGADWAAARTARADDLVIDGIDSIRFNRLATTDLRLLNDSNSASPVLQSTHATARIFSLQNLQAYHLAALDVNGATIRVHRNSDGMRLISRFFPAGETPDKTTTKAAGTTDQTPTFVLDSAHLNAPSVDFLDASVTPPVHIDAKGFVLEVSGLDTARPNHDMSYRLTADLGEYAHIDSFGTMAPLAPRGTNMDLVAYLRSLALAPLSGYLNAALGRRIARGVANGSLTLAATDGQLDGKLDVTLSNVRLANRQRKKTDIAYGISMDTALDLVRDADDNIDFTTLVLGDLNYPQFSVENLVREAVLAGLRTALTSTYSPLGLLNSLKNAIVEFFSASSFRAVPFRPGFYYVLPDDRPYLSQVVTTMIHKPAMTLTITGHASADDAAAVSPFARRNIHRNDLGDTQALALARARAIRDYIASRGIDDARLTVADPVVDQAGEAQPRATLSIDEHE